MDYLTYLGLALNIILLLALIFRKSVQVDLSPIKNETDALKELSKDLKSEILQEFKTNREEANDVARNNREELSQSFKNLKGELGLSIEKLTASNKETL